jgi:RNA polymerase sigma-70 factor (ECF subfamily)
LIKEEFESLVDKYSRQVLNTALRILGDAQKAEDVHQEVFLAIWKRWDNYDGQTNWNGYLYRVTVRKAIEFAKKVKHAGSIEDFQSSGNSRPDSELKGKELHQRLSAQLEKLPKRQADVFVLARLEGMKSEKIAEILGCSEETVRVHLHRATKKLAEKLKDLLD